MAEIKLKIASVVIGSGEGGGSGVAPYYADLPDKPSINGETLSGDMTSEDLGLASDSQAVPSGGTTGQVLAKKSNADNDVQWVNQQSGGQGTTDYSDLENKPKINNVTLSGNKTAAQLGLQAELVSGTNIKTINNQSIVGSGNITIEGGGTNVEANPQGAATATLSKLKIGETIYTAPQGEPGVPGADGQDGQPGPANTLSIGTVTGGEQAAANITGTAPNQVLNLTLPKGAKGDTGNDAINPFKGWWPDLATLKAAHTATAGDSAYVKDASPATTWSIYVYDATATTDNNWADSGLDADTSHAQTFASGEEVNLTPIDETHLSNPLQNSLARALDVVGKMNMSGVTTTAKDLIISLFRKCAYTSQDAENIIANLEAEFEGDRVLMSITAELPTSYAFYDNQSLDDLRSILTVTADYDDGSTVGVTTYTLQGNITAGTSVITVLYGGMSATVEVDVTHIIELTFTNDEIVKRYGLSFNYDPAGHGTPNLPYSASNTIRCAYPYFDKRLEGGKSYKFTINTSDSRTKVGLSCFTQSALDKVENQQDFTSFLPSNSSIDGYDAGWQTFINNEVTVAVPEKATSDPLSVIRGIRLTIKIDDGSSGGATIPSDYSIALSVIEVVNN